MARTNHKVQTLDISATLPQAHQARLQQCIVQQGGALAQALLVALCEACPRSSMRPMAMLLHGLLTGAAWQEPARGWLGAALQSAELQGTCLSDYVSRFYMLLLIRGMHQML